jgi:hypothetical protein
MSCLKCGQEVSAGQIFCDTCLADMERHPVKPGTPVIIPKRSKPLPSKRTHKRLQKPEDLIAAQRQIIGWLITAVIILILAVAALTFLLFHFKTEAEDRNLSETTSVAQIVSRETIFDNI